MFAFDLSLLKYFTLISLFLNRPHVVPINDILRDYTFGILMELDYMWYFPENERPL